MRDALGAVQSVLVLGGNSEIALAIVDRRVASRCRRVLLGVRDPAPASDSVERLRAAGAETEAITFDAREPST
ncbi:MAG: decaprenylphospho-beta-D-erythro-pentofuranosid-2-ulose 2-reductase, partial [Acidimicrobiia bacterium]